MSWPNEGMLRNSSGCGLICPPGIAGRHAGWLSAVSIAGRVRGTVCAPRRHRCPGMGAGLCASGTRDALSDAPLPHASGRAPAARSSAGHMPPRHRRRAGRRGRPCGRLRQRSGDFAWYGSGALCRWRWHCGGLARARNNRVCPRATGACRCQSRRASSAPARRAASATWGTETGVRSPERIRRANGIALQRVVVPRSPAFFGNSEGATPPQAGPCVVRERESPDPHGPAAETNTRGWRLACIVRLSWSISRWRVPMAPRERPSAGSSWATAATASASLWTSIPM